MFFEEAASQVVEDCFEFLASVAERHGVYVCLVLDLLIGIHKFDIMTR